MSLRTLFAGRARLAASALLGRLDEPRHAPMPAVQAPPTSRGGPRTFQTHGQARSLTPARVAAFLQQADDGDPSAFAELCQEIEDRDTHIVATLGVRRRSVANLGWGLQAASEDARDRTIAAGAERAIRDVAGLEQGFMDLLDAVMKGYAAVEIMWGRREGLVVPRALEQRPQQWLRPSPDDASAWNVVDVSEPVRGVPLWPRKWVVHTSRAKSGHPVQAGLGRALVWWYLFKTYATRDWVTHNEKFGSPLRVGTYQPGTSPDDITLLEQALQQLGVDAAAVVPAGMEIDFVSDAGVKTGGDTWERFLVHANREISKAILGQTLTTEEGSSGSLALGQVHNDVRADLRDADARELASTLTRDLVGPIVELNWGASAPTPRFVFNVDPPADRKADAEVQEARGRVFAAARALGVPVSTAQVREELGLRTPEPGEPVLGAVVAPSTPFRARPARIRAARSASTPVAQFEVGLGVSRERVEGAWRQVFAQLRAELGDTAEAAEVRSRAAAILRSIDLRPYTDELAAATLRAAGLGRAQLAVNDARDVRLPSGSPLTDDAWAEVFGLDQPEYQALVERHRSTAADAGRHALLRSLQDVLAGLEDERLGDGEGRARAALDRAEGNPARSVAVVDGAATGAWGEGRWEAIQASPGELYLRYHTVGDDKVRRAHRAMEGRVYPARHPIWQVWRPPNGYGCRCWVTAHNAAEVRAAGWTITEDFPQDDGGSPQLPDKGWRKTDGGAEYQWDEFPTAWVKALEPAP